MNLETIIDMQVWCRTWPPNGSSLIRAKQKLRRTHRSLQKFLEPIEKLKVIYTDNSLDFGKASEDLSWNHCTSTPHRSETNGIAERAVRRVKEGTSAVLLQSGLNENWWADSVESYTYLRNVTDLLSDGKTPYERRSGQPFQGPIIKFEELETMDASEIYSKRLNAKEVIFPEENGKFIFPAADGRIKLPGGD